MNTDTSFALSGSDSNLIAETSRAGEIARQVIRLVTMEEKQMGTIKAADNF